MGKSLASLAPKFRVMSKFWGFPYRVSTGTGRLVFAWSCVPKVYGNTILVTCLYLTSLFSSCLESGDCSALTAVKAYSGQSIMDVLVNLACTGLMFTSTTVCLVASWKKVDSVSDCFEAMDEMHHHLDMSALIGKNVDKVMSFFRKYLILLTALFFCCCFYFNAVQDDLMGPDVSPVIWRKALAVLLPAFGLCLSYLNPSSLGFLILSQFLLHMVIDSFNSFKNLSQRLDFQDDTDKKLESYNESIIKCGLKLCLLLELCNTALEPFLATFFSFFLSTVTCMQYSMISLLFNDLDVEGIGQVMTYCFISLICVFTLKSIFSCGQQLEYVRAGAKARLEEKFLSMKDPSCPIAYRLRLLISKMEYPDPISPYAMFGVNNAGSLSAMTTIFTYLIVLLQFRISEK